MTKLILVVIVLAAGGALWYLYVRHLFESGYDEDEVRLHVLGDVSLRFLDRMKPGYRYRSEPKPYREDPPEYLEADSESSCGDPLIDALMNVSPADVRRSNQILKQGGWQCACGKVHAAYVSSCTCGRNKNGELPPEPAMTSAQTEQTEADNIAAIREYKKLMDEGILTAEEFEAKKKQLLGL